MGDFIKGLDRVTKYREGGQERRGEGGEIVIEKGKEKDELKTSLTSDMKYREGGEERKDKTVLVKENEEVN